MRILLSAALIFPASSAMAHPGHLIEVAGHNHWIAGGAIGAAVLAGLWAALKGRTRGEDAPEADQTPEDEREEASA